MQRVAALICDQALTAPAGKMKMVLRRSPVPFQAQSEDQKHQIEALTAQLEHLTASKAHLESRCHLLEKVVKMREEAPINANPQARIRDA